MLFVLVGLLGLIAWQRLPKTFMPDLHYPQLMVLTSYPNASSLEIETLVTKTVEEACATVKGVRRLHSKSKEGLSLVTVVFNWGVNMDFASLNLREKIDLIKGKLPREAQEPRIEKFNPFARPVMVLSISGTRSEQSLLQIAKRPVAELLEKVPGVAAVSLTGGLEREILIELEQARLATMQIPILDVIDAVKQGNITYPAGTVKDDTYEYVVRVKGAYNHPKEIERTAVKLDDDKLLPSDHQTRQQRKPVQVKPSANQKTSNLVLLSELGTVSDTVKERSSYARYNGQDNIALAVLKQGDAHSLDVASAVKAKLPVIQSKLPHGIKLSVVYDQSTFIQTGIKQMVQTAIIGAMLACVVLVVFLGSWRQAFIVGITIPLAVLGACFLMLMQGITLNTLSLAGIAIGIGLLVDGAIVVIENISRHQDLGCSPGQAAVQGAREVLGAVTSSIGTTLVVFLPLIFVSGLLGQLFEDLSWSIIYTQLVALAAAFTLIPMLASRKQQKQSRQPVAKRINPTIKQGVARIHASQLGRRWEKMKQQYLNLLDWCMHYPLRVLGLTLVVWLLSLIVLIALPRALFPKLEQEQLLLHLTMPLGTRLDVTNQVVGRIEEQLATLPAVTHQNVTVGSIVQAGVQPLGSHEAELLLDLNSQSKLNNEQVVQTIKQKLTLIDLMGGRVQFEAAGHNWSALSSGQAPVMVEIKGYQLQRLQEASQQVMTSLNQVSGLAGVQSSFQLNAAEIGIDVDRDQAATYSLSVTDLAKTVLAAVRGKVASKYREDGKEIDIRVRLSSDDRDNQAALNQLLVHSPLGMNLPLRAVAEVKKGSGPNEIIRYDQQRTVLVTANLKGVSINRIQSRLEQLLMEQRKAYPQLSFSLTGDVSQMRASFQSLKAILIISLLLVYMIMAAQFESFWKPLIIILTIPLTLLGLAPALLLTGHQLSAMAGMGMILLIGIVVNNGIVLIDYLNQQQSRYGQSLKAALREACQVRLRPIVMTAGTTILGLMPLALGLGSGTQMQAPMAVVVVSGLLVATALTLLVLPAMMIVVQEQVIDRLPGWQSVEVQHEVSNQPETY